MQLAYLLEGAIGLWFLSWCTSILYTAVSCVASDHLWRNSPPVLGSTFFLSKLSFLSLLLFSWCVNGLEDKVHGEIKFMFPKLLLLHSILKLRAFPKLLFLNGIFAYTEMLWCYLLEILLARSWSIPPPCTLARCIAFMHIAQAVVGAGSAVSPSRWCLGSGRILPLFCQW